MNITKRKTVLITGASSGIGYELTKVFADHNYNLVLVARNFKKLQELSTELINEFDISVHIITKDLSMPNSPRQVFDEIKKLSISIDVLVNNAGLGKVGLFHELDNNDDLEMIGLNITSLTELTKLFSREMVKRKEGKILNIASTGSYHPGPFTAVYYATKAYVLSFSEAISKELEPFNITVTTVCPGATKTNFAKTAGKRDTKGAMSPNKVAKIAFKALENNNRVVVPGLLNKFFVKLPRSLVIGMIGKYQRNLYLKNQ